MALFGRRLPESARWLIEHGHLEEAEAMVASMEQRFDPKDLAAPAAASSPDGPEETPPTDDDDEHPFSTMHELTHGRHGLAVLAMAAMWFLWYIGNYGFLGDAATLFSAHGLGIGSSILYLAVGAIGYPVGAGIMVVTADRVERKHLIFAATVCWLIGMLLVGTLANGAIVTIGSFLASLALGSYLQVAYTFTPRTSRPACGPGGSLWLTGAGTSVARWAPSCCRPSLPGPRSSSGSPSSESPGCWPG